MSTVLEGNPTWDRASWRRVPASRGARMEGGAERAAARADQSGVDPAHEPDIDSGLHGDVEPSDGDLLELLALAGDRKAFDALVRRHSRAVYLAALSVTGVAADAEELAQDAFLVLWRRRTDDVRLVADSVAPWLIVTARNLALNRIRGEKRLRLREERARELTELADPQAELLAATARDAVDAALAGLDPLDAQIARLCLADGLSYAEAAEKLGVAHGVVRNRLSRTRRRLRDLLGNGSDS
ncbi:RNA polymerase sigma factor [Naasia lichenicola]|uniref:RNA polymerase sigma factor n=1 Tax=Naasia lichenicola TaxID=2565933 RepID=A0A4V6RZ21_9MICO|nr:RNA polymerase sigma factor [Naasia lichenicola]THG31747.1 RNA polymerase sigma factor [Naasia lichenicola]